MGASGGGPNWATVLGAFVGIPSAIVASRTLLEDWKRRREQPREPSRRPRRLTMTATAFAVIGLLLVVGSLSGGHKPSHKPHHHGSKSGSSGSEEHSGEQPEEESVPELSSQQLAAVLVPEASYDKVLPESYDPLEEDHEQGALQGGISKLKLCSAAIPVEHHLRAENGLSYSAISAGPTIHFGSEAGSFDTRQSAELLLQTAKEEGEGCGWRALDGALLGEQVVRLTTDKQSSEDTPLHVDLILMRDRGVVVEIGSETVSGAHSAQAEVLAEGAATRLARAVRKG
jgi:hypothetical protein